MATPAEKLASSLEILYKLQGANNGVIRSRELARTHRERLVRSGYLREILKGWFLVSNPADEKGISTTWYASFWQFAAHYLNELKGDGWCLSPEQSILLQIGNWTVPQKLQVRSINSRNRIIPLPQNTSLFDYRGLFPPTAHIKVVEGLRVFDLPSALIYCGVRFFESNPTDVRVALSVFVDASEVLAILLDGGHSSIAGRLAGAFRNNGQGDIANDILTAMRSAGNDVRESDPFNETNSLKFSLNSNSAYSNRIRAMWEEMRDTVIKNFPPPPKSKLQGSDEYLRQMDDLYVTDAYHSLSIEGYSVTPELIQEVSATDWVPTGNPEEYDTHNAWAAHGYWKAYQAVCTTIKQILAGKNAGEIVQKDHRLWYSELFSPGVIAGIIQPSDLAGYRNTRVYIRHSRHVPPNKANLLDGLTTFFELLKQENSAAVRVVLGHFVFVHIHPYMDGNGRLGRFLMNAMLASGGYPWLVVPHDQRNAYMEALEQASVNHDIKPFTQFLANLTQ